MCKVHECTRCVVERGQLGGDDVISLTRVTRSRPALPQHTDITDLSLLERALALSALLDLKIGILKISCVRPFVRSPALSSAPLNLF